MATIRVDKKKSGNYLSLIESYRDDQGKSRMRTLANLGKVENYNPETLKKIGKKFFEFGGGDPEDLLQGDLQEQNRYNFGYVQIVDHLMRHFGLDGLMSRIERKHNLTYNMYEVMMLMLIERLNIPCSKLSNFHNQKEYYSLQPIELQWIYRSLDKLDQYSDAVQQQIYLKGRHLFNQKLDVVFYDVTTFYFDSSVEQEDALRQKGFSKDGKIGKTQIVFGMLIDKHKQPVSYHIFQGNTSEGQTLKTILTSLNKKYNLGKVIVVADRAMLSQENIDIVTKDLKMPFIFGERLKSMPKQAQKVFLDKTKYTNEWVYTKNDKPIKITYYSAYYKDRKVISTHSEKRARKDKHDREKRIEKAKTLLSQPSRIDQKATHHYLRKKDKVGYQLNEEKIKHDELFDGILAISTNVEKLTDIEVLDQYRHLFQIEQGFRTMKSVLEVRPMFHWTDKRIRGHICMCFIAFAMLRNIELRLEQKGHQLSERSILKALDQMQVSQITQKNQTFYMRSKATPTQEKLIKTFGLRKIKALNHNKLIIR